MKKSNKKGFTIVELVIVIAVIGILATVLIPTFSSVVDKANKSAAEQELKNAYTLALAEAITDGAISTGETIYILKSGEATKTAPAAEATGNAVATWKFIFTAEDTATVERIPADTDYNYAITDGKPVVTPNS